GQRRKALVPPLGHDVPAIRDREAGADRALRLAAGATREIPGWSVGCDRVLVLCRDRGSASAPARRRAGCAADRRVCHRLLRHGPAMAVGDRLCGWRIAAGHGPLFLAAACTLPGELLPV